MTLKQLQEQHDKEIDRLLKRVEEMTDEAQTLIDAGRSSAAKEDGRKAMAAAAKLLENATELLEIIKRKRSGEQFQRKLRYTSAHTIGPHLDIGTVQRQRLVLSAWQRLQGSIGARLTATANLQPGQSPCLTPAPRADIRLAEA